MAGAGPPDGLDALLAHVTDVHFGRDEPGTIEALLAALNEIRPQLVVVGGDLTQRARAGQFRRARAFLDALEAPWLAVPETTTSRSTTSSAGSCSRQDASTG